MNSWIENTNGKSKKIVSANWWRVTDKWVLEQVNRHLFGDDEVYRYFFGRVWNACVWTPQISGSLQDQLQSGHAVLAESLYVMVYVVALRRRKSGGLLLGGWITKLVAGLTIRGSYEKPLLTAVVRVVHEDMGTLTPHTHTHMCVSIFECQWN